MTVKNIQEDSEALATLHPGTKTVDDPKSKVDMINKVLGAMYTMKDEHLTKWFTDSMALIGHEADKVGDNSDKNKSTIDAKPSDASTSTASKLKEPMPTLANITPGQATKAAMKEDVDAMFDGQDLTEEFKDKVSTLFEAAVELRANVEVARLEEEFNNKLEEAVKTINEDTETKLSAYLDYVAEQWMAENKVAVESTLKTEITEEFITGLKKLFTEHYIDIPEDKVQVVESLTSKVEELEGKLNSMINENASLKSEIGTKTKKEIVESFTEGLALSQAEKLVALTEGIDFDGDINVFTKKVGMIKEAYFPAVKKEVKADTQIVEEVLVTEEDNTTKAVDPSVAAMADIMSRTFKK